MESGDYFGQSAPQLPQKFDRAGGSIKTIVKTAANIVTETAGLVTGGSGDTSTANRGNGIDNLEPWPSLLNADATCAEWCTCMRNEMLYATTWSIPYKVETFNGMSYYRIRMIKDHGNDLWVRFNPDATHGKWEWTNEIDKDHEGQTPEGQEVDYYSLDENEAFEDGGVPVRLQFIMRLMPYFLSESPTLQQFPIPTDRKPLSFLSKRDCAAFHTKEACENVQKLLLRTHFGV